MDSGQLTEQKLFQGAGGIGGLAWADHEQYVDWISQYGTRQPVRRGHPMIAARLNPQESLHRLDVSQTRFHFPSGLEAHKWGFTGTLKSSDGAPMGDSFIPGNSTSTTTGIWMHAT